MGINIDLYFFDREDLQKNLKEWGVTDEAECTLILEKHGTFLADKYIILNNEAWNGGSPLYMLGRALDEAFKLEEGLDIVWATDYTKGITYVYD